MLHKYQSISLHLGNSSALKILQEPIYQHGAEQLAALANLQRMLRVQSTRDAVTAATRGTWDQADLPGCSSPTCPCVTSVVTLGDNTQSQLFCRLKLSPGLGHGKLPGRALLHPHAG